MTSLNYTAEHTMWQQRIARETRHKRKPVPSLRLSLPFPETYPPPSNPNLLRDIPFHHTSSPYSIVSTCNARLNLSSKPRATALLIKKQSTDGKGTFLPYKTWAGPSLGRLAVQAPLGLARSRQFIEASVRRSLEADLRQANTPKSPASASVGHVQELRNLLSIERKVRFTQRRKQLEDAISSLNSPHS